MIERTQTMCVALSYVAIATKISCKVTLKKLWYFLIDVCNSFHSLRHFLINCLTVSRVFTLESLTVCKKNVCFYENRLLISMTRSAIQGNIKISATSDEELDYFCILDTGQNHDWLLIIYDIIETDTLQNYRYLDKMCRQNTSSSY